MSIVRTTTHKSSRRVAPGEKAKDRAGPKPVGCESKPPS